MFLRHQTKVIQVGSLYMGGNHPIIIQSMTNTPTKDIKKTVQQILDLEKVGCQLIRVAILDMDDATAIQEIKKEIHIPIVADIHFDYRLALKAIESGADKIRINPGNIGDKNHLLAIIDACKKAHIPIRIGVNSGSIEKDLLHQYGSSVKAMIESVKRYVQFFEENQFYDLVLSLKSSSADDCIEAYQQAATLFDYPLHIGITESGPLIPGIVKTTTVFNRLLSFQLGNTIRVSLSDDPIYEIKVAKQILKINHLITMPTLISCPTCGRTQIDLIPYAKALDDFLYTINKPITVALMGCVVNGPGEAKEADIGIAGGNKVAALFKKGKVIQTIPEDQILSTLKEEIKRL